MQIFNKIIVHLIKRFPTVQKLLLTILIFFAFLRNNLIIDEIYLFNNQHFSFGAIQNDSR
jgi:hypothetical protein